MNTPAHTAGGGVGVVEPDKAVGMLLAAAAGDALGWPQENRSNIVGGASARAVPAAPQFRDWVRNGGTQYSRYLDPVAAGQYSDDTQLMLAVGRACLRRDWLEHLTSVELPFWPTYQRGGGGAVLAASRAWAEGRPPWRAAGSASEARVTRYFDAGGNGVAMRVAPHALVAASDDKTTLVRRVIADGVTTHGHPRALVGAVVHALAIRHAVLRQGTLAYGELLDAVANDPVWRDADVFADVIAGEWIDNHVRFSDGQARANPAHLWERTCSEVDELLGTAYNGLSKGATANDERTLGELGLFDKQRLGAGTVCAVSALYVAARTASRPMSGLLRTAFLANADTDTVCSMTGAILGALQGTTWLTPLAGEVQDRDHIANLALELAGVARAGRGFDDAHLQTRADDTNGWRPGSTATKKWVKALFENSEIHVLPDGRGVDVEAVEALETKSRNYAVRARLVTRDGQTLLVDRVAKTPSAALKPPATAGRSSGDGPRVANAGAGDRAADGAAGGAARESEGGAGATASGQDRDGNQVTEPAAAAPANPTVSLEGSSAVPQVVAVEFRVADLAASERFFAHVLGFAIERLNNDRSSAGPLLRLSRARTTDRLADGLTAVLTIAVPDLDALEKRAAQFGGVLMQWAPHERVLWLVEPGGNVVRAVAQANPPEPAPQPARGTHTSRGTEAFEGPEVPAASATSTPDEVAFIQGALFDTRAPRTPGQSTS